MRPNRSGNELLSMLMMAVDQKDEGVKLPVIAMLTISWPDDIAADIDLHVRCPNLEAINFTNKTACFATLERDARSRNSDTTLINGQRVTAVDNREVITFRKPVSGEWVISIHYYGVIDKVGSIPVTVELMQIAPNIRKVMTKKLTLEAVGEEKHAFRFEMSSDGVITSVSDQRPTSIINGGRFRYE
jgi:uncharacterized protein YfaP (DUF2135 family)